MAKTAQNIVTINSLPGQLFQATDEALTPDGVKVVQGASGQIYVDRSSRTEHTSIADIRAATSAKPLGENIIYMTKDLGVPGQWLVDSTDTTSADNTGTILVTAGGQRLKRKYKGPVQSSWFPLMGDGIGDDTAIMQDVINNFKNVNINAGSYLITVGATAPLLPTSDTTITFDRGAELLVAPNALDGYVLMNINGVSNVKVDGMKVVGDKTTHTGTTGESGILVEINNSKNVTINNVDLSNAWGDGIYVSGPVGSSSEDITLSNLNIYNCRRNGISATNVKRLNVINATLHDMAGTDPQSGIDIEPNAGQVCEDIILNNIQSYNNTGNGIENHGNNITLSNFICKNNGRSNILMSNASNVNLQGGILDTCASHGIDAKYITDISIVNVSIKNSGVQGISLLNADGKCAIALCNAISDNIGDGIVVNSSASGNPNVLITGNTIENNIQGMLIYEHADISHNVIRNNTGHAIERQGRAGTEGCIMSDNTIYNNGYDGIRLAWNGDKVHHNNIYNNGTNATVGWMNIHLFGTVEGNNVSHNKLNKGTATNKPEYDIYIDSTAGVNTLYKNEYTSYNTIQYNNLTVFDFDEILPVILTADELEQPRHKVVLVDTTAGDITYTLNAPALSKQITFKKISDDANKLTVIPDGTKTIDGATTYDLTEYLGSITVMPDTTNNVYYTLNGGGSSSSGVLGKGTATLSGDGSTTSFTISSAFGAVPGNIQITPTSEAAAMANFYVSAKDSTGFTIKAAGAIPPAGSANLTFNWVAYKS